MSPGIPDGARWTPVPDLFFSRHLVELDDPNALKVALFVLWRMHRRPAGAPAALRVAEVVADPTLGRALASLGVAPEAAQAVAEAGLARLVEAGLLVTARVAGTGRAGDPDAGPARWVFVNGREGRAAQARLAAGDLILPELPDPPGRAAGGPAAGRPNVFALYEENIGLLTPILAEELEDAAATFPAGWIEDAFRLAVENNVRKWAYVHAILERWAREGREHEADQRGDPDGRARDSDGPYAAYIER